MAIKLRKIFVTLLAFSMFFSTNTAFAASLKAPANLSARETSPGNIRLDWDPEIGATNYRVYEINNGEKKLIREVSYDYFSVSRLAEGDYEYAVSSVNGTTESGMSETVSINITYPELESPASLGYSVNKGNDVTLTWSKALYANSYNVYRTQNGLREFVLNTRELTTVFENVPEDSYLYEVTTVNNNVGESNDSSKINFDVTFPAMQAPTNLNAIIRNETDIVLRWDASEYADSYNIYKVENGEKTFVFNRTGTAASFKSMPEGTYTFEVESVSERFGKSSTNAQVEIQLVYPEMQPPNSVTYEIKSLNDIVLSWEPSSFAEEYRIYQIVNGQRELVEVTNQLTYTNEKAAEGKYFYEVTSVNSLFGESNLATYVEVNMKYPEILSPINFVADIENGNDIVLSWEKAKYANEYKIYQVINNSKVLIDTTRELTLTYSNLEEGKYVYEITSNSVRIGESKTSTKLSVDLVHPTMMAPESLTYRVEENDIYLKWPSVDHATSYNVYEIINGKPVLLTNRQSNSYALRNKIDGHYSYVVSAVSERFGESFLSEPVIVELNYQPDKTAPITSSNIINNWAKGEFVVELKASDDLSGVEKTFYSINGSSYIEGTTFEVRDEGITEVSFYSIDKVGNIEQAITQEVKIDKSAPKTTSNIHEEWMNTSFRLEFSATDKNSGIKETHVSINGSQFEPTSSIVISEEGIHTVAFFSVDRAGNIEEKNTENVKIDYTAPVTTADLSSGVYHKEQKLNLIALDNLSGVEAVYYSINGSEYIQGTTVNLDKGVKNISFYSVDKAGNEEDAQTLTFWVDDQAPVTTSNLVEKWYKDSVDVELIALDDISEIESTYYSVNGTDFVEGTNFTVLGSGIHQVAYYSIDKVGNKETIKIQNVNIDSEAPITASNIKDSWISGGFLVNLNAMDQLSGIDKTFISVDGLLFTEGTILKLFDDGKHDISYYSTDIAGNVETIKTETVMLDSQSPVTISTIEDRWYQKEAKIELTATDNLSGVAKTFYSVNGSEFVEGTSFTVTDEAVNEVSFYSVDHAGNVEEVQTVQVKIDKTTPVTSSNVVDVWDNEDFQVKLTPTDNLSGVEKTFYSVNGSEFVEGTSFTVTDEAVNEVSFYSVDHAGNVEEVQTVQVKIDKTTPVTSSNVVDVWDNEDFQVKLTPTDNLSGVEKTFYSVNGSEFVEGTSFTVTDEAVNEVSFYSVDHAGNVEGVQNVQVKIDKTAPTISLDVAEEYALGTDLPLTYIATDNLSGIASEKITVNGQVVQNGEVVSFDQPGEHVIEVEATDLAGWTTIVKKTVIVYIPATIEVLPKVVNGNKGVFTVKVDLPMGYSTKDFTPETAMLNGVSVLTSNQGYYQQAKHGQFKFEREYFIWIPGKMTMEFEGKLGNLVVKGQTDVKVIGKNIHRIIFP